ncbi:hypothetical protein D3C81_1348730 [compost metagenome]
MQTHHHRSQYRLGFLDADVRRQLAPDQSFEPRRDPGAAAQLARGAPAAIEPDHVHGKAEQPYQHDNNFDLAVRTRRVLDDTRNLRERRMLWRRIVRHVHSCDCCHRRQCHAQDQWFHWLWREHGHRSGHRQHQNQQP